MKKLLAFLVLFLFGVSVLTGVGYCALSEYYQDNFAVNTWINGVYCTGKTVEEVNEELVSLQEASVIVIADANRTYWEIDMDEAGIRPDYTKQLEAYRQKSEREAGVFTLGSLEETSDIKLEIQQYVYDEEKLKDCLYQLPLVQQELEKEVGVKIYTTATDEAKERSTLKGNSREDNSIGEYYLWDGNTGRLNLEKVYEALKNALDEGESTLSLVEEGCYEDLPDSEADLIQRDLWEKINHYSDTGLVYDMGAEAIEITAELALSFLEKDSENRLPLLNENGSLVINETAVNTWVDELIAQYNTANTEREFQATRGELVTVKYSTYGTELSGKAEKEYLLKALQESRSEVEYHIPTYIKEGYVRGLDDIGNTYVEIDLTNQKMYYYQEGELLLETEVVTGDLSRGWSTPQGICYVYGKSRKVILRGPDYESFVEYWMPVWGGVGIHDANWRYKFGGEIYKKNGSHGCINTPPAIMDEYYEAIELGTPVIMFY